MNFGYKIWIEQDGKNVFGMGIYSLLSLVDETGSLHKAAQSLQMSYRAAWGKVRDYEDRLGVGLLEKGRHGRTGAHLTDEGRQIVLEFHQLIDEMDNALESQPISRIMSKIENIGH